MGDFINALMKTEPEIFEQSKEKTPEQTPQGVSLQDMKDYFEALKQEMSENMRKEIIETLKAQQTEQKDTVPTVPTAEKEE